MSKFILLFIFLFSSLSQAEEFPFIGFSASTHNIDRLSENSKETSVALRLGRQTLDWRTTFVYDYSKGYQALSMEIDKILLDELFGTPKIRPFLGLSTGLLQLDDDNLDDRNGFYYGANFGFIFYTTDRIDINLAYHYKLIQDIEKADNIHGATVSLHYFF